MGLLRKWLDGSRHHFEQGGRLHAFHAVYEATDSLLYTPGTTTRGAVHVRDGADLKRIMTLVVVALIPCIGMAMYNTGYQAHQAIAGGASPLPGWRTALHTWLGLGLAPGDVLSAFVHGALYLVPLLITSLLVGGAVEVVFAQVRRHPVNEGFFVTAFLYPLTLPPGIELWQAAFGIAFGVFLGKEIFGGTGMNFLNPALTARAFVFFAYPAAMSGNIWVPVQSVDAMTGATLLAGAATDHGALAEASWWDSFVGLIPGSLGETSALLCIVGAAILLVTRIASWRIMVGVIAGTFVVAWLLNTVGSDTNPMFSVPPHWHIVLGGWAFGTVFMATDPVSATSTDTGRFIYGFFIGVLVILIRCINPAYPEGMMLAILLMNVFAPLIDHFVVRGHVRRRRRVRGES